MPLNPPTTAPTKATTRTASEAMIPLAVNASGDTGIWTPPSR
jgi:hypothetical protein